MPDRADGYPDPSVFALRCSALHGWLVLVWLCLRLTACHLTRRGTLPDFVPHKDPLVRTAWSLFRWHRLRIVGARHCPDKGPALFVANHHGLDDPALLWPAIHLASKERFIPRFLMRDDFFRGFPWDWLPLSLNTLCERCGAVLITRGQTSPTQLRQALQAMRSGEACVLFPSGTRSRTGVWLEYRPGEIEAPGSPAALAAVGARVAGLSALPVVPAGITRHPVSGGVTVTFGEPMAIEARTDPAGLARKNAVLCAAIGELVEVHAVHLTAALLWTMSVHGRNRLSTHRLVHSVTDWVASNARAVVHPELWREPEAASLRACQYFVRQRCVGLAGNEIILRRERTDVCPPWTTAYRKINPVRYWTNQILHLKGLDQWAVTWATGP